MDTNFELFTPVNIPTDNVTLNLDLDDVFFIQSMERRAIEINKDIDEDLARIVRRSILQINKQDEGIAVKDREPIKLIITSFGGDVASGFSIIDMIQSSITPVHTYNVGYQYSMAAVIGVVGRKRYATKNATFLIHEGSTQVANSIGKLQDFMMFDMAIETRIKDIVVAHTNISEDDYASKARNEWYFFADEAKELGVIDGIIGEDIGIEEII